MRKSRQRRSTWMSALILEGLALVSIVAVARPEFALELLGADFTSEQHKQHSAPDQENNPLHSAALSSSTSESSSHANWTTPAENVPPGIYPIQPDAFASQPRSIAERWHAARVQRFRDLRVWRP